MRSDYNIFEKCQLLLLGEEYAELIELCTSILLTKTAIHDIHLIEYYLGISYFKTGKIELSIIQYQKCLESYKQLQDADDCFNAFIELELAGVYNSANEFKLAIEHSNKACELFLQINDPIGISRSLYSKGTAYLCLNKIAKSIEYFESALSKQNGFDLITQIRILLNLATAKSVLMQEVEVVQINSDALELLARCDIINTSDTLIQKEGAVILTPLGYSRTKFKTTSYKSNAYGTLSTLMSDAGLYDKAIPYIMQGIELARQVGNGALLATWENNIAKILLELNQPQEAFIRLQQARNSLINQADQSNIAFIELNTGKYYMYLNSFEESLNYFNKAIKLFEADNRTIEISTVLYNIALLYHKQKQYENAADILEEGLSLSESAEDENIKILLLIELGVNACYRGSDTGIQLLQNAIQLAEQYQYHDEVLRGTTLLAEALGQFGYFEKSHTLFRKSIAMRENVFSTTISRQFALLSVIHKTEILRKENEILFTKQELLVEERNHLQAQLTMNNQSILIQMNELNTFRKEVLGITKQLDRAENIVRKVKNKLRESPLMQETWGSYLETFTKVHPGFQVALLGAYPDLTAMEIKVCILIRAGLQTEEISQILSLSTRTIENHRFNLRKKLHVGERENLAKFLMNV